MFMNFITSYLVAHKHNKSPALYFCPVLKYKCNNLMYIFQEQLKGLIPSS